jgi:large subunit ribosomal protein L3
MVQKFMGRKQGMIQLFDEKKGKSIPCTVIQGEPNVVTQIKTKETDGYNAIQIGYEEIVADDARTVQRRAGKPQSGHFKKAGTAPRRFLKEARVDNASDYALGQEIGVDAFAEVKFVDAVAISKGKGYQGTIKKYGYAGGPAAHGSGFHRHAGSTGMRSTPGRCFKGGPRPSHMGSVQITVQNLEVVMVNLDEQVIVVKGQVPGPRNGFVCLTSAKKKS